MYEVMVVIEGSFRKPTAGPFNSRGEAIAEAEDIVKNGLWSSYDGEDAFTNPTWIKSIWVIDLEARKQKEEREAIAIEEQQLKAIPWYRKFLTLLRR